MTILRCEEAGYTYPDPQCGTWISIPFFMLFTLLGAFILLNLVIGVILENFSNIGSESKAITVEQLEEFREVWLKYDPKGTFTVPSHNLLAILQEMLKHLGKLDIPDHGGYIHFIETLTAVSHNHA